MKYMDTPMGTLMLDADDDGITRVEFVVDSLPLQGKVDRAKRETDEVVSSNSPLLKEAERQLREYFDGKRQSFDLPLSLHGTPFQLAVWAELQKIPCGETRIYGDIARALGRPGAARAVGMANHRNPVCIVVPCHRVIGADGSLTGYAGGLDKKQSLLKLEGVHI